MKNILFFVFTFYWSTSQCQTSNDLTIIVPTRTQNVYVTAILADGVKKKTDRQEYRQALDKLNSPESQKQVFDKITGQAVSRMEKHKVATTILDINSGIIKASTSGVPVFGQVTAYGMDRLNEFLLDESVKSMRAELKYKLEEYKKGMGQAAYDQLVNSYDRGDPSRFLTSLNDGLQPIERDFLKDVPDEEKGIVQNFYTTQAVKVLKGGLEQIVTHQASTDLTVDEQRKNIKILGRAFYKIGAENKETMDKIVAGQEAIVSDIRKFQAETNQKFDLVYDFMYSRMSVSERKNAINQGMVGSKWSDEEKERELKKLELLQKQEALQETVNSLLEGGNELVKIAASLGLDKKTLQLAGNIVQGASIANKAYKALTSGNFLGAIGAITDLFGLGGPDVGEQRHEEIIKNFQMVFSKLDQMDAKLDLLLKGQEQIIRNQAQIFRAVEDLSIQISNNHLEVMDLLREMQGDILTNRKLIMTSVNSEYAGCDYFSPQFSEENGIVNTRKLSLPTLEQFYEWWLSNTSNCHSCEARFVTIYVPTNGTKQFAEHFKTGTYKTENNKDSVTRCLEIYKDCLTALTLFNTDTTLPMLNKRQKSLFQCVDDNKSLRKKTWILRQDKTSAKSSEIIKDYLLDPNAITMHCRYIANFHLYYSLINPLNDHPYTYDEILSTKTSTAGIRALEESLSLVKQAIAQQNLLAGDILLPVMNKIFMRLDTTKKEQKNQFNFLVKLLNENSILAKNFLQYQIKKEVELKKDKYLLAYAIAFQEANKYGEFSGLKQVTKFPWEFNFSKNDTVVDAIKIPKGVSIKLGKKFYTLPHYQDLAEDKIVHTPDYELLLNLRDELLDELASYKYYSTLTPNERATYNTLIVR